MKLADPKKVFALTLVMGGFTVTSWAQTGGDLSFYHFGDPSEHEQLMMELINRARADPGAEAARLGIGLNAGLAAGTIVNSPKPPLAWHDSLISAARGHTAWMLATGNFNHSGQGGSTASQRAMTAGYPSGVGENLAWGGNTNSPVIPDAQTRNLHDSLFRSSGHRKNICNGNFKELGIGVALGTFNSRHAMMVTQNYGTSASTPNPFVTGVVFYDFDGDGFYDPGEGVRGIGMSVNGGSYRSATSTAGGYSLPVPGLTGSDQVLFIGDDLKHASEVIFSGQNQKVDLMMSYPNPVVSPRGPAVNGIPGIYDVSPVPGATSREVSAFSAETVPADGANNLTRMLDGTSSSYSALSTSIKRTGSGAYRFAHPTPAKQFLQYHESFLVGSDAQLRLWSFLGWATSNQEARIEVSTNGGITWETVYQQVGTNAGGVGFQLKSVPLGAYAGATLLIRLVYDHLGGAYFPQTNDQVGWYVDDLEFVGMERLALVETLVADNKGQIAWTPGTGRFLLTAKARHHERTWPEGPSLEVIATEPSPFHLWAMNYENANDLPLGTLAGDPTSDWNGDGVSNLLAYALGIEPVAATQAPAFAMSKEEGGVTFRYHRIHKQPGVSLSVQISADLQEWHEVGTEGAPLPAHDELVGVSGNIEYRRVLFPGETPEIIYLRWCAELVEHP